MSAGLVGIDVAIGLIMVYLVVSIACSAANELIAGLINRRSKYLSQGLAVMLGEDQAKAFYEHPLIASLKPAERNPSYIPSRTFALVLMDLLRPAAADRPRSTTSYAKEASAQQHEALRKTLLLFLQEAGDDVGAFRDQLEIWYNSTMDRVSGWYKRNTQFTIAGIALAVVVLANVDTIHIAETLVSHPQLRQSLVDEATRVVETENARKSQDSSAPTKPQTSGNAASNASVDTAATDTNASPQVAKPTSATPPDSLIKAARTLMRWSEAGLPLGWQGVPVHATDWLNKILGLLLTALAASLGAPFWFDILNKFVNVRTVGRSPEETPHSPEAMPKRSAEQPPQ